MTTGVSAPDPFTLNETTGFTGWNGTTGLTIRSQVLNPVIRNLVLISAGQSQATSINPTLYTPSNTTSIDNLNVYDGGSYAVGGPLLGCQSSSQGPGNVTARVADLLIGNGIFDHVLMVPIAIGSTTIADWSTGNMAQRFTVALRRLASRGITPSTTGWTFAVIWWHGETDGIAGTTAAVYTAGMNTVLANMAVEGFTGSNCRFFINTETWASGVTYPAIQTGQANAVIGQPTKFFTGGNVDSLNATNRQADNTHFNDIGAAAAATLVYNAMHASGAPF